MSRFLHNEKLSLGDLESAVTNNWYTSSYEERELIVIQDTTDINAVKHRKRISDCDKDLGLLWGKNMGSEYGFFLHPCLIADAQSGFPLGFSSLHTWNRQADDLDRHERNYKRQAIEEKTSYRWLSGVAQTQELLNTHRARRYHVMDREADIYELFVRYKDASQDHLIIRTNRDRLIYTGLNTLKQQTSRLWAYIKQREAAYELEVAIPRGPKSKARLAKMELFYEEVQIKRPKDRTKAQGPDRLNLWLIHVEEQASHLPEGQTPIKWTIWTTVTIDSLQKALWIIETYKKRWLIEEFFSLLKTKGLQIESAQVESGIALKRLTILACQAALIILQLIKDRDNQFQQPLQMVLEPKEQQCLEIINKSIEGKTEKLKNPYPTNSLARLAWVVARLGGYSGYQSQSPPGPKTMAGGWKRFSDMMNGIMISYNFNTS